MRNGSYGNRVWGLYCIALDHLEYQILVLVMLEHIRGGPKNNQKLNVACELEVVARCAARCYKSIQYSSSPPRGINLG